MTLIAPKPPFVILEDSRTGCEKGASYLFSDMKDVVEVFHPDQVDAALNLMEAWRAQGLYAAGWIAYEAGVAFEPRLTAHAPQTSAESLIWFAAFARREQLNNAELEAFWQAPTSSLKPVRMSKPRATLDYKSYAEKFQQIQHWIRAGDVYQVNLTFPLEFMLEGDVLHFYKHVREAQRVGYSALIVTKDRVVLSFSPELFIQGEAGRLQSRPMKGTRARPFSLDEDEKAADHLRNDEKSKAENLMIVDLIRNDLSRIAAPGSVKVPSLFKTEAYTTVLQMTSQVEACSDASPKEVLQAMFPCGSVTGAPKIRAMEIIQQCETAPRGIYTGAIGQISPWGDFSFSVPIRTLISDNAGHTRLHVGSGIVADSDPLDEYQECLMKARFLTSSQGRFDLFETLYRDPHSGYRHLDHHLERLYKSARYFDFALPAQSIMDILNASAPDASGPQKVRILMSNQGAVSVEFKQAPPQDTTIKAIAIAQNKVDSGNVFLRHKTSIRAFYDQALAAEKKRTGCFDALLLNERGEICEGCFTSFFLERNGRLYTPALKCGLLPGVLRHVLLQEGRCEEAILYMEDLHQADALFIGNSLRGLMPARLAFTAKT